MKIKQYAAIHRGVVLGTFSAYNQKEAEDILETDYPEASRLYLLVCSWPEDD